MRSYLVSGLLAIGSIVIMQGCSSGSSDTVNVESVSNVSSTFDALEGLLFDESSGSSKLSSYTSEVSPPVGSYSRMACHYSVDRQRMFQSVDRLRSPLCHISKVEGADIGFTLPQEEYGYYNLINLPQGENENSTESEFRIRIGKFTVGGRRCIKYQTCKGATQDENFSVCEIDGGVSASVANTFSDTFDNFTFEGSASVDIEILATNGEPTSASIDAAFSDTFGQGSMRFEADKALRQNFLKGAFSHQFDDGMTQFSQENGVCIYAGGGEGTGKVSGTYAFPAIQGCPNGDLPDGNNICNGTFGPYTESFTFAFNQDDPLQSQFLVAETSAFADLTQACELPTSPTAPTGFGSDTWDTCEAPNGFTEIDISLVGQAGLLECEKYNNHERNDSHRNCDQEAYENQTP